MPVDDFCNKLAQLLRVLKVLDKEETSCCGRTMQQNAVIEALDRSGPLAMNVLSNEVGVAISTMTRVVDLLVRDGLVNRVSSPTDRRRVDIALSKSGNRAAANLRKRCVEYSELVMQQIPESRREQVLESLDLLIKSIDTCKGSCCS